MVSVPQTMASAQDCGSDHTASVPQTIDVLQATSWVPQRIIVDQAFSLTETVFPQRVCVPQRIIWFHTSDSPPMLVQGVGELVSQCRPGATDVSTARPRSMAPFAFS